jgi:hypothetical protein
MREFRITTDSKPKDLESFALALHNIVKLPLTIRSLNANGLRIEDGKVIDYDYTGPILEMVLKENKIISLVAKEGPYKGKSVLVAPIRDEEGSAVAAMGISDTYGAIDFIECFCKHTTAIDKVEKCLVKRLQVNEPLNGKSY